MVIDKAFKEALLDCFKQSVQQTLIPAIEKMKEEFAEEIKEINPGFVSQKRVHSYQDNIANEQSDIRRRLFKLENVVFVKALQAND